MKENDSTWLNTRINLSMAHYDLQVRSKLLHVASHDELAPASLFCPISLPQPDLSSAPASPSLFRSSNSVCTSCTQALNLIRVLPRMAFPTFRSCLILIHRLHTWLPGAPFLTPSRTGSVSLLCLPHPHRTVSIAPTTFCCVCLVTCPSFQDCAWRSGSLSA